MNATAHHADHADNGHVPAAVHTSEATSVTPSPVTSPASAAVLPPTASHPLNEALDQLEDRFGDPHAGFLPSPDAIVEAFTSWVASTGRTMYPHQEDALLAIAAGDHVIAATPTGSGKSLIAAQALFTALANGKTGYYTAPLKALVSEKFFELIKLFGAHNVGMVTGDVAINANAPIVCATAEILANISLRDGSEADVGVAVMDEFHFYADPQRGWAWQVPLLELTNTQHVLLSATLGDTSFFERDMERRTGRTVTLISGAQRPVPLNYRWSLDPLEDVIRDLVATHMAPVYVVYFSQREAVLGAQALLGTALISKERKEQISRALGSFRFGSGFGQTLSKLLRSGIGVHHAGLLPRYRRLVERLAQAGLLAVICGTDTLGVGINVPIRTVLITSLAKFDGNRMRHLTAREFHQIAGRAGRAGFDTIGYVVVQAPDYEIENERRLRKAGDDPAKIKRVQKVKPEEGKLQWSRATFEKLRDKEPETLTSHLTMTHAIILNLMQRPDPVQAVWTLLLDNHEPPARQSALVKSMLEITTSLEIAGVIERRPQNWLELATLPPIDAATTLTSLAPTLADRASKDGSTPPIYFTKDVPDDFALNAPLSPFALSALDLLDPDSESYALDVLSVIEAVQEDPTPVLFAQRKAARSELIGNLKADGVDYNERMALADEVTWPMPLAQLLEPALETYAQSNPWVRSHTLSPKSIVREMIETASTFTEFVSRYGLQRSEGVLLRYLTDTYRALRQIVPISARDEEVDAIMAWLNTLVRSIDSSLLDEWEALADGHLSASELGMIGAESDERNTADEQADGQEVAFGADADGHLTFTRNKHALRTAIRNELFTIVQRLERDDLETLSEQYAADGWTLTRWDDAAAQYWDQYDYLGVDTAARSAEFFSILEDPSLADLIQAGARPAMAAALLETHASGRIWLVTQVLDDGEGDYSWALQAFADLDASDAADALVIHLLTFAER
ncbi:MAG: DUF3516 domain-containing protein [Actinomycetaceae bacterium]|nr:DUF3516 domain-containing protein [Arcanobacterium sp.]MDD7686950.1 DUF3516 domain-containing protein [Actinomycetaceae bacterium]MDY5273395.1 DUF3516 domain-containing protein [Arcanobacterium sp.]